MKITKRQLEIIEAAGKILSQSGVSGLRMKTLASEIGFSESAIYRHFSSKEEMIVTMLHYLAEDMDARYSRIIIPGTPPTEKFSALFESLGHFFHHHPHFVVAVFSDGLFEESQRINQAISKIMSVKMKHLLPIIREGQQTGDFTRDIDAEQLVHIIMGSFRLLMFQWRSDQFRFEIQTRGMRLTKSLLTLIKNK